MKKKVLITIILLITIINYQTLNVGAEIKPDKTFTTAECEKNVCQDYLIECAGKRTISKTPITGKIVFPKEWEDPRKETTRC